MSTGLSIAQVREALKRGDMVFPALLDVYPQRKCELCGNWNGPPNVHVPGAGFFCIGCEAVIRESETPSADPKIKALVARYDGRVAASNAREVAA